MTEVPLNLDTQLKKDADLLFQQLGLDFSTAVGLFLRQSIREGGIPFAIATKTGQKEENVPEIQSQPVCTFDEFLDFFEDNAYLTSHYDLFFYQYFWKTLEERNGLPSTKEECIYLVCALVKFYQNFMKITLDEYFDGVCLYEIVDSLDRKFLINDPLDEEYDEDEEEEVCPFDFLREKTDDFPLSSYISEHFSLYPLYYHMALPFTDTGRELETFEEFWNAGKKSHTMGDPMAVHEDYPSPWVSGYQLVREYF